MGNSSSSAAVAAGGVVQAKIKKEKKRAKRFGCVCGWCNFGGLVFVIVGIALLVYYASSLGSNYTRDAPTIDVAKGLTYTGIAFLLFGLLCILVGVLFAVGLYLAYKKITGKSHSKPFKAQNYAPGTAPYPQQDWGDIEDPHQPAAPVAPQVPGEGEESTAQLIVPEIH